MPGRGKRKPWPGWLLKLYRMPKSREKPCHRVKLVSFPFTAPRRGGGIPCLSLSLNKSGEWIGWVTPQKEVYSVLGNYAGFLTSDARVVRKRADDGARPQMNAPPAPQRLITPAHAPLAPLMSDLPHSLVDILAEEPERLHTVDTGELRNDLD